LQGKVVALDIRKKVDFMEWRQILVEEKVSGQERQHCHNQALVAGHTQGESSHRTPAEGSKRVVCCSRGGRDARQKPHSSDNEGPTRFYYLASLARHGMFDLGLIGPVRGTSVIVQVPE
jgi:hypothetical protein